MKGRIKYRKTGALRIFEEGTEVYMACARPLTIDADFFEKIKQSPGESRGTAPVRKIFEERKIFSCSWTAS